MKRCSPKQFEFSIRGEGREGEKRENESEGKQGRKEERSGCRVKTEKSSSATFPLNRPDSG